MGTARNDQAGTAADDIDPAALAQARSNVYALLAAVFRAAPDAELLARLRDAETARLLEAVGFPVAASLPALPDGQLVEDLAVEYTRLFLGPGPHLSLHESVNANVGEHSEAALWTERTARVKAFIETAGLSYAADYTDLPDHVSAELEFMQRLTAHESAAHRAGRGSEAAVVFAVQRKFFTEHLGAWLPSLCDKVSADTRMAFYKAVAELAKEVADFEARLFAEAPAEAPAAPPPSSPEHVVSGRVN